MGLKREADVSLPTITVGYRTWDPPARGDGLKHRKTATCQTQLGPLECRKPRTHLDLRVTWA